MNNFFIIALSGAVIGYFTNWLAIKMLFRPREEKRIFGFRLPFTPGIIPKEKRRLAKKLGETVGEHLLTGDALAAAVTSEETLSRVEGALNGVFTACESGEDIVDQVLALVFGDNAGEALDNMRQGALEAIHGALPKLVPALTHALKENPGVTRGLKEMIGKIVDENTGPLAGLFINKDKLANSVISNALIYLSNEENQAELTRRLDDWVRLRLPEETRRAAGRLTPERAQKIKAALLAAISFALEKGARHVAESIPVERIVEDQINAIGMIEGERIVTTVLQRELRAITALGGVLGFLIGVVTALAGGL